MASGGDREASPPAQLSEFASQLRYDVDPGERRSSTPSCRSSTRSAARCSAPPSRGSRSCAPFVLAEGGRAQATLWGTSTAVSSTQAALVNATAAHSFEFDDIHMGGMIHPGALALGAAIVGRRGSRRRRQAAPHRVRRRLRGRGQGGHVGRDRPLPGRVPPARNRRASSSPARAAGRMLALDAAQSCATPSGSPAHRRRA